MPTEPAIRTVGLEKSFGAVEVLRGVDLDVAPGTIVALLGANGAGKTTLVKILATLLRADAGTAVVHGSDVATDAPAVRGAISLTGQFAAVDEQPGHPGRRLGHLLEAPQRQDLDDLVHVQRIAVGAQAELQVQPPAGLRP